MPPLVVPEAMLAVVSGEVVGSTWTNVLGIKTGNLHILNQASADAIGGAIRTAFDAQKVIFTDEWSMTSVVVQDLRTGTAPAFEAAITPVFGTSTGTPLPANLAAVATHRTALRGKSYRGRSYVCGFPTASIGGDGRFTTSYRNSVVSLFTDIRNNLAAITGTDHEFAVVSRTLLVATPVVATTCDGLMDHQDRRKPAN